MKIFIQMIGFQVIRNLNSVFDCYELLVETYNLTNQIPKYGIGVQP
jgi:hypothetical protein